VGGARTAIYNWLLAKAQKGKYVLRIEDTDQERSTESAVKQILTSLQWLGLDWDDDIWYQSQRLGRHQSIINILLETEQAYRCFCTSQELKAKRTHAASLKQNYIYDGTCRNLTSKQIMQKIEAGMAFSIRLKTPDGNTRFEDGVHGTITIKNSEFSDFIIARSDGTPVYQLAVVVDDHDMGVTHVVRGDDHISNTPKQIAIFKALNWAVPDYSHLPLILGSDKRRLSKRHGATAVEEFKEKGILPSALFNYLSLLGWAPGNDREIMTRQELIDAFNIHRVNTGNAVFDMQKLEWMNSQYIMYLPTDEIVKDMNSMYSEEQKHRIAENPASFSMLIDLLKPRSKNISDFVSGAQFYFKGPESFDDKGVNKFFNTAHSARWLQEIKVILRKQEDFGLEQIEHTIRKYAEKEGVGAGKVIHPLRLALTGKTISPGIFEVINLLGKEQVLDRLQYAIQFIEENKLDVSK
jgi:glutamyl-tRNA synthetase